MIEKNILVSNTKGLHARAATKLAKLAMQFSATLSIEANGKKADCKSVMSILLLAASTGTLVTICADGSDEQAALTAIEALFADKFEEDN